MANIVRIKRRAYAPGGLSGAPANLKNAELAYNENDRTLYYGLGISAGTTDTAAQIIPIAGSGFVSEGGALDTLSQPLTVFLGPGGNQGSYDDGEVIPQGTALIDLVKNMLQKQIPASYNAPTLSLSNASGSYEIGSIVNPVVTGVFTQRDGGSASQYRLSYNGDIIYSDNAVPIDYAYTMNNLQLTGTHTFQASVDYLSGAIKNDNQGNPSPSGSIQSGTVSSAAASFTTYRKYFYGTDTQTVAATTSNAIRGLANSGNSPADGTTFTINIPVGTRRVTIAYPDTIPDIGQILYAQAGNNNVADTFEKTIVQVEGANGYGAIAYKVFTDVFAEPNGAAMTYNVTI